MRLIASLLLLASCNTLQLDSADSSVDVPRVVSAVALAEGINLTWSAVPGAESYVVYAGLGDPMTQVSRVPVPSSPFRLDDLVADNVYSFRVAAIRNGVEARASFSVRGTPLAPGIVAPLSMFSDAGADIQAQLGFEVAVGNLDDDPAAELIVGAPSVSNKEGAALVYRGTPNGPLTPAVALVAPDAEVGTRFGEEFVTGDVSGDGIDDLLVGAPWKEVATARVGMACLFLGSGDGVASAPLWCKNGNLEYDQVGRGLLFADLNHDGINDVVVSTPSFANNSKIEWHAGPIMSATLDFQPLLTGSSTEFGYSLAWFDADGDGYEDLLVSEPGWNASQGRVRAFAGSDAGVTTTVVTTVEGGGVEAFGSKIVSVGDLYYDSSTDFAVVAGYEFTSDASVDTAVYLYGGAVVAPVLVSTFFGGDRPLDATICNLGEPYLLIGDPGDDAGAPNAGRVLLQSLIVVDLSGVPAWQARGDTPELRLGDSVACGDLDGDGLTDVIAGGSETGDSPGNGVVQVYRGLPRAGPCIGLEGPPEARVDVAASLAGTFTDPVKTRHACEWQFGDGSPIQRVDPCTPVTIARKTHVFALAGHISVTLRVEAKDGRYGEASTWVEVSR